jgi:hypothetical protein
MPRSTLTASSCSLMVERAEEREERSAEVSQQELERGECRCTTY